LRARHAATLSTLHSTIASLSARLHASQQTNERFVVLFHSLLFLSSQSLFGVTLRSFALLLQTAFPFL
jgi:hypothetical protein